MDNLTNKVTKKNIVTVIIIFVLLCLSTYGAYAIVKDMKAASASPLIYNESHDLP